MIRCDRLSLDFSGEGVFDISLQVAKHQALGLLGPVGAGKSLLLRVLAGLTRPDSGEAFVLGMDSWDGRHHIMKRAVYLPGVPALEPNMTGEAFLRFYARYHGGFNPEKARKLSERLDVTLTGPCRKLSIAARKKLGLLCALSLDKEVYLLDEPLAGLLAADKQAVADAITELRKGGAAVLLSSRILEDARRTCTQVAIIRKGRLVVNQPVEALSLTRQKVYHITFSTADQAASFAAEWEGGVELIGTRALVAIPASPAALLRILARYEVADLTGGREEAEEDFLRYHGDDLL